MEIYHKRINFKKKLNIIPLGDIHLGSRACDEKKLDNLISWILTKEDTYVLGMGDYVDAILRTDLKRFSARCSKKEMMEDLDSVLNEQRDLVIKKFKKLAEAGKLLGLLRGNHEEKISKYHQYDIMKDLCQTLNVPNLGYSCYYRLYLTRGRHGSTQVIDIYAHHGHGSSRRTGGSVNRFDDIMKGYEADIYLMGHDHKKWGKREIRLYLGRNNEIIHKPVIIGRTGTFLRTSVKGFTTYSEEAQYSPNDLGVLKITLRFSWVGDRDNLDIHVSE